MHSDCTLAYLKSVVSVAVKTNGVSYRDFEVVNLGSLVAVNWGMLHNGPLRSLVGHWCFVFFSAMFH